MVTEGLLFVAPKLFPTIVTIVPPAALPCPGSIAMTDGGSYSKTDSASIGLETPFTSTTTGLCEPTPSGVSQRTEVEETHTTCGQGAPPTATRGWTLPLPVPKFIPPIVIIVPPAVGPLAGLMSLIPGVACELLSAVKLSNSKLQQSSECFVFLIFHTIANNTCPQSLCPARFLRFQSEAQHVVCTVRAGQPNVLSFTATALPGRKPLTPEAALEHRR
eukprot:3586880-Rhodomonas_salina.1